jgi:hypothetical protein
MVFFNKNKQSGNSFQLLLEQYECSKCKLKFYINIDDKPKEQMMCPECSCDSQKIRKFGTIVNSIIPYE